MVRLNWRQRAQEVFFFFNNHFYYYYCYFFPAWFLLIWFCHDPWPSDLSKKTQNNPSLAILKYPLVVWCPTACVWSSPLHGCCCEAASGREPLGLCCPPLEHVIETLLCRAADIKLLDNMYLITFNHDGFKIWNALFICKQPTKCIIFGQLCE